MNLVAIGDCMGAPAYFKQFFDKTTVIRSQQEARDAVNKDSIIMYGGGEDISPDLYKAKLFYKSRVPFPPSRRDRLEQGVYELGVERGAGHYGICRGAQMLCALSGGRLFQHVNSHAGGKHEAYLTVEVADKLPKLYQDVSSLFPFKEEKLLVTSAHHQAVDIDHLKTVVEVISLLENSPRSNIYQIDDETVLTTDKVRADSEGYYIPKTRVVGIQGHPEFDRIDSPFVKFCQQVMQYLIENKHEST